jgi:hypothetical protein
VVDRVSSIASGMPGRPFSGWRCCDEDRKEHVFAFPEGVGFGIASLDASSEEAQALREALYQIRRKQKIVTIEGGRVPGYGHEFTNRSKKMYSESQSRKAERHAPRDCTARLRGGRCPTKSDLEIGFE